MERDQEVDHESIVEGKEVCGSDVLGPRGACDAAKEPATPAKGSPKNDTPRIRSSSSSSSSKSKCDDSEKIVKSDAFTEPPRSSSSRPVETTPSVSSSKDMYITDEAVTVHLFLFALMHEYVRACVRVCVYVCVCVCVCVSVRPSDRPSVRVFLHPQNSYCKTTHIFYFFLFFYLVSYFNI